MRRRVTTILLLLLAVPALAGAQAITTELAGESLAFYPWFHQVRTFNGDGAVEVAVDPNLQPQVAGVTADVYVVASQASWTIGDPLTDAGAGADSVTFVAGSTRDNRFQVAAGFELPGNGGADLAVPYDVVVDLDRDGLLSDGDLLDGGAGEPGLFVIKDLTFLGPYATSVIDYSVTGVTPGDDQERTWFPTDIDNLGPLPLVIIGHGNGHDYDWYDYLQEHLASHGYIVMSHENNTSPGIESASTTTLEHTDAILGQQGIIGGGVLNGNIDSSRITWIGHSRGGEGVARAYDRIFDGSWSPVNYSLGDIKLVSSIAPTDFLGTNSSNPHGVDYHFLYGSADGDVCGCPGFPIADAFSIFERAEENRSSTYLQGADHNDFNCCGFNDFDGPPGTEIGRTEAQEVAKADYLAVIEYRIDGNLAAKDYLWRQIEDLRPPGVSPSTIVVHEFRDGAASGKLVIDDYQSGTGTGTSSSGGAVFFNVGNLDEGDLFDNNSTYTWQESDPFNGMARGQSSDTNRGVVFDADGLGNRWLAWEVPVGLKDFTGYEYLSFRAAQGTRHPLTDADDGDLSWAVALRDTQGNFSFIDFGVYGGGIEEPYQRTGYGSGAGWQNEFETVRIRLSDFLRDGKTLDLSSVRNIAFFFRGIDGFSVGRIGLDDLELNVD